MKKKKCLEWWEIKLKEKNSWTKQAPHTRIYKLRRFYTWYFNERQSHFDERKTSQNASNLRLKFHIHTAFIGGATSPFPYQILKQACMHSVSLARSRFALGHCCSPLFALPLSINCLTRALWATLCIQRYFILNVCNATITYRVICVNVPVCCSSKYTQAFIHVCWWFRWRILRVRECIHKWNRDCKQRWTWTETFRCDGQSKWKKKEKERELSAQSCTTMSARFALIVYMNETHKCELRAQTTKNTWVNEH